MLDLGLVARELVRAIRGKRSQELVNRRLGFRFNQLHRWERGTTKVSWPDFVRLCEVCKAPLARGMTVLGHFGDPHRADLLVEWLLRPVPIDYATDVTGISRAKVVHWRARRATPSLEDVLRLVHGIMCATVELARALVDLRQLPSLAAEVEARRARSALIAEHPAVEAVLATLELAAYAALPVHDDEFIARNSGIDREEARLIIRELAALGAVVLAKKKYSIQERWFTTFDVRRDYQVGEKIKAYWLRRAADFASRVSDFSDQERFTYLVFSASADVARAIDVEYTEFVKRTIALLEGQRGKSSPRETVRVVAVQLFAPGR